MNTDYLVVFTKTNARILSGVKKEEWTDPSVLWNPDLSLVKRIPPHYWKREGDKVVPMSNEEKVVRDKLLASTLHSQSKDTHSLLNDIREDRLSSEKQRLYWFIAEVSAVTLGIGILLFLFCHFN